MGGWVMFQVGLALVAIGVIRAFREPPPRGRPCPLCGVDHRPPPDELPAARALR